MDFFPVISQVKSFIAMCEGDMEKARQIQVNFSRQCPIASQITSAVYAGMGNAEEATKVQLECAGVLEGVACSIPVAGFVASGIAAACGDVARAQSYAKACARSTGVLAAGAAAALTGGAALPIIAGVGVASGVAMDGLISGVESAIEGEYRPNGSLAAFQAIHESSQRGEKIGAECFEQSVAHCFDMLGAKAGASAGKKAQAANRIRKAINNEHAANPTVPKSVMRENLRNCIEDTKSNADFLNPNKKGGPVQCNMKGGGGTDGQGMSLRAREAVAVKLQGAEIDAGVKSSYPSNAAARRGQTLKSSALSTEQLPGRVNPKQIQCAEHIAAEVIYKCDQTPVTSAAARVGKGGKVYGAERCSNCLEYNMGAVPTDHLHKVHLNPRFGLAAAAMAVAPACRRPEASSHVR